MSLAHHVARALGTALRLGALALLTVTCSAAWSRQVVAQDDTTGAYKRAVTEGLAEFEAQNYLESRALFLRAHKLQPSARTLRSLGAVDFELRRYAESVSYLTAALAAPEKPLVGALREETASLRQRALGFVAELRLRVTPAHATSLVDGEPVASSGTPLWLDIGQHTLAFEADGHQSAQRGYRVEGGESDDLTIALTPTAPRSGASANRRATTAKERAPRAEPGEPSARGAVPRPRARLITSSVLAGVGALGLGLGAFRFHTHVDDGREVRMRSAFDVGAQSRWLDSRPLPLVLAGAGVGLLTASSALAADFVPRRTRRWLSPILLTAGAGVLATGLTWVRRGERCEAQAGETLRSCVLAGEQRDRGLLVSLSALPLLTMPALHALSWLRGR
jgi:hypothetical protein